MRNPFRSPNPHGALLVAAALAALLAGGSSALAEVVLHRGNGGEPQTLDQAHTSIDVEGNVLKDLYEGLTVYDPAGKVIPGAAESWTVSDDKLTYTFKLRPNAKWSDGSPVTADDFVFSYQRLQNPKEAAEYANLTYVFKNAEAINTKGMAPDQLGVKAIDPETLEITLERPTPYLLELLAHQSVLPVNKRSVEKNGADFVKPGVMVSNGAFKLTENVANDHITAVKNENYWGAADVKLDKVVFYPLEDQAAAVRRFQAGELDVNYYFPTDQTDFLRKQLGEQVHMSASLASYYYVFDTRKEPFNDVRVRKALSMAVDREFLSHEIFQDGQIPLYSAVPPGIASYGEPEKVEYAGMDQLDREDKAKELLKEAGWGEGGKSDGDGLAISRRRITLSTSGVVPMIRPTGEEMAVGLAISLHAVRDELRNVLVPINRKYPLAELMDACRTYPGASNARRITFEYVMLKGVNDSLDEARELVRLLKGIPAKINLIPFNPWPGSAYECSDWDQIERFADVVNQAGYASPIRTPRGRDIFAACGQLKSASERMRKTEREAIAAPN